MVDVENSTRAPEPSAEPPTSRTPVVVAVVLAGVLLVAIVLRFLTKSDLWLDEALTVNIAKVPFSHLQTALKHDGAPPLYYVLLHGWISVFGSDDVAVRALSGIFGVIALVLAYPAGARLARKEADRRWAGWAAVLVVAASPYAIRYSTEVRMYMLAMVLVLLGDLTVGRILDRGPSLGRLAIIALVVAALLYTQYWSIFLLAVVGGVLVVRAFRAPEGERATARKLLGAMVVGGVIFLPWVPTFLYQNAHTGTPWDQTVTPPVGVATAIIDFGGEKTAEGWFLAFVLVLLAILALSAWSTGPRTLGVDLRTVPGVRWEWFVGAATLLLGLGVSYLGGTGFQGRYAAVMYPLYALCVAIGVLVFSDPRIRVGLLVAVVAVGFVGGARNVVTNRTQASQVVDIIAAEAKPGDLVVSCPDQLGPDTQRLLSRRSDVREVVYPTFANAKFVDWVDYKDRNAKASPTEFAARALRVADGHAIWVIWALGYRTLEGQCEAMLNAISAQRPGSTDRVTADEQIYEFMGLRQFKAT
ncbi:MAG: glycosyltransferase family 39 protein [Acidimicrobiia bacterium]